MRKRLTLTVSLAVGVMAFATAAALAANPAGPGADGNVQGWSATVSPSKLSKSKAQPASLNVVTDLSTTTAANGVPVPANRAVLDFDKNVKLFTKGIPTCTNAKLQNTTTTQAKAACPNAVVGSGSATVPIRVGTTVFSENVTVTAFNGAPQGGKPVLLVHTFGSTPVQFSTILTGVISNYNKQGYGPRLNVQIPPIAGGTGSLTHFQTEANRKYSYKGKKRSYVSAMCATKKLEVPRRLHLRRRPDALRRPALRSARLRSSRLGGFGPVDVDLRHDAVEPARLPPDALADQQHQRRQQDDADHGGVEDDRDGEADADLADGRDAGGPEGDEDGHHDRRRAGDHAGGFLQAEGDRGGVIGASLVGFAHPHQQEDRVVDREPEDDAEDHRHADRVDVGVAAERVALGHVQEQGEDAEGDADGEHVEGDREGRQQQHPQHEHQHQEGGDHDGEHHPGDAGRAR